MSDVKIILAEDDFELREMYLYTFEKAGFTVVVAEDGEQALKLGKEHVDAKLMLLDVMMPKMHGINVLKQLKADQSTQRLPVLMLSNLSEENVINEALKIGAIGYVVKAQMTPQQVVAKVTTLTS